jgi:O-antigen/teichoic acid export membrane protein
MFRPRLGRWREIAAFGGTATTMALLDLAYDLLPGLLMDWLWNLDAVGIYARAVTVCRLPGRTVMGALQPVVLPAMAARARHGGDLKEAYLRGHALMSAVQWPALALLAYLAVPAVRILLGGQWLEATPLIQVMAIATMALPVAALMVVSATFLGPRALAASLLLTAPWNVGVALWFISRATGLCWQELAAASRGSALTTLATVALPLVILACSLTGFDLSATATVLALVGALGGWLAGLFASAHPFSGEITRACRAALIRSGRCSAA